jgi:hypothetical protein
VNRYVPVSRGEAGMDVVGAASRRAAGEQRDLGIRISHLAFHLVGGELGVRGLGQGALGLDCRAGIDHRDGAPHPRMEVTEIGEGGAGVGVDGNEPVSIGASGE